MTKDSGPFGNTIEAKDYTFEATADGGRLTINGPYETTVVNISREQLDIALTHSRNLSFVEEARVKMAERELGNDVIYRGPSL